MAVVLMASFLRVGNGQFVWMPYRCIGYAEIYIYHVVMYVSQCKIRCFKIYFKSGPWNMCSLFKFVLSVFSDWRFSSSNVYSLRNDHKNQGVFLNSQVFIIETYLCLAFNMYVSLTSSRQLTYILTRVQKGINFYFNKFQLKNSLKTIFGSSPMQLLRQT